MISSVATTRCNIFCSHFCSKCLRSYGMLCGNFRSKITCNLLSYMDYFIRHPSGSRVPMRRDPKTGLMDQWTMLETVGPLPHGLWAPFLKLKIELTKLQAANWNTLIGLLSLAITNLWKVDLGFKYLKVNQNEMLFQRSILIIEQCYNKVCFHTSEENK